MNVYAGFCEGGWAVHGWEMGGWGTLMIPPFVFVVLYGIGRQAALEKGYNCQKESFEKKGKKKLNDRQCRYIKSG